MSAYYIKKLVWQHFFVKLIFNMKGWQNLVWKLKTRGQNMIKYETYLEVHPFDSKQTI